MNSQFKLKMNKKITITKIERKKQGIPPNKYYEQEWELTMNPNLGRPTPENIFQIKEDLENKRRDELMMGRVPGDASDKIGPYMEPLFDNLKFIKSQFGQNEKKHKAILEMQESGKILITPLAFIRGRSLSNIMFIIDEAQNLTPHEVKTIITRAGENTKIVFTGDVHQIDTPYLDENSNGLAYLIDRLTGQKLFSNVKLEKGERSDLANMANDLL